MSNVKDILAAKGADVWSVSPGSTVFEALELMAEKRIGAVLVMEGERLVGIFSERDYARKVVLVGKSSRESPVSDVMTRGVLCVAPERSVDDCLAMVTEQRARHLPVVDAKKVVGLVSIGDLVKATIQDQQVLIDQLQDYIVG